MRAHLPRLGHALHQLLCARRTAALATLGVDGGAPGVSLVPFAIDPVGDGAPVFVLHVSALAAHTAQLQAHPRAALLISAPEMPGTPVHDLARVAIDVVVHTPERDSPAARSAQAAYTQRFPDAAFMTELPDFRFVTLTPTGARQIAGFGSARSVGAEELAQILALGTPGSDGAPAPAAPDGPAGAT